MPCSVKGRPVKTQPKQPTQSRVKINPRRPTRVVLDVDGTRSVAALEVKSIDALVKFSTNIAASSARLRGHSKYLLDIMIHMEPTRKHRHTYVVKIGTRKTRMAICPGSRGWPKTAYRIQNGKYPGTKRKIRGKYVVQGTRRRLGRRTRRALAITSLIKVGREYKPPKWSGNIGARYTRSLSPESARHSLAGTVPDNPGAPATRPAGPGLPEGGDAADYD